MTLRIGRTNTIVSLITFVAIIAFSTTTVALGQDKPSGFSGYLLDSAGLDGQARESAWSETFESAGVSWRYVYQDGSVKVSTHKRVDTEAHGAERSEYIKYEVEEPGVVVFGHYVDYPSVYDETAPSLWIRSDRPGVALAALVVFPNTLRPDTNTPLTALLVGSTYQNPGEWRRLTFPQGLDKALEKTTQAIRGEHKIPVDRSCAYIRQILLISEARRGKYSLWIDDLEIKEHIRPDFDLLSRSEQRARFDPINLLSSRLELSQTPIFWQDDPEEADVYGREPFEIDQEKVARNKKQKLNFSADALASLVSKNSTFANAENKRATQGFGTALDSTRQEATFAESAFFLPTSDDVLAPFAAPTIVQNNAGQNPISTDVGSKKLVGQTGFVGGDSSSIGQVSQAAFASNAPDAQERQGADYLELQPTQTLTSGSGTLQSSDLAAESGFFRKGEKLTPNVRIEDGILTTPNKRVLSIRAIEYNGESFEFLKKLGFNAVWLNETPTPALLKEASETGVWLVAFPPEQNAIVSEAEVEAATTPQTEEERRLAGSRNASGQSSSADRYGSAYDPVLMWNVGANLHYEQVVTTRERIGRVRRLDDQYKRPFVASVFNGLREYSQGSEKLNVVLLDRNPILTSLDLNDYGQWLDDVQLLTEVNSVAFWDKIQTQPDQSAFQQRQYFGALDDTPGLVTYEQMRQCVRFSMRAGCRGLLFGSSSPLDAKDHKTEYRAKALEAINLELQFLLTWFALGVPERTPLETSDSNLSALVFKANRALLVAPISTAENNQYVMGQDAAYNWEATVPVPESYSPDLLTPGALRKILAKRKAGGSFFSLEEGSMNSLLFFTQTDSLSQKMTEYAQIFGKRMAELAVDLAQKRVDMYEQTVYGIQYLESHGSSSTDAPRAPILGTVVNRANEQLDDAETSLRRRDVSQAYLAAERATREIRNLERTFWEDATSSEVTRPVTPLSTSFYDMPAYLELYQKLITGKLRAAGPNLILGGDMENPSNSKADGWQFYQERSANLSGEIRYDAQACRNGSLGLLVKVFPQREGQAPKEAECPVMFAETSFPTRVGQLVCIQGWIKIPKDLTNSTDGLLVYEDQGGQALALRFKKACNWKRFAFYRLSTNDGPMRVRFAFSGCGEVYLDDVAAFVVQ
ncbi:MAG: hypothetical protein IJM54_08280 [Thermoguttaceae bacterium]|nr:hypothetical protein [Thermoguttaceae bacterium]